MLNQLWKTRRCQDRRRRRVADGAQRSVLILTGLEEMISVYAFQEG